jgi:hypothetical protein
MRQRTALVLSVVLHACALLGLSTTTFPRHGVENARPDIVWLAARPVASPPSALEPPLPAAPVERPAGEPPAEPSVGSAGTATSAAQETASSAAQEAPDSAARENVPPSPPAGAEASPPDLFEASRRAAAEVLEERDRAGSYRSLTYPGTLAEQEAFEETERFRREERGRQAPLTAFDSPAKGRAGMQETSPFGKTVRWVSDDCYQTVGSDNPFLLPATAWLFAIPMTNCATPPPRGDLFASAKPDYSMDADERAAAAAERARRERLRRPTTGAVMSLEGR